jgi:FAD/FMN-containing dehydrogenase
MGEDSSQYIADNEHAWISSSAASACSVEPGSAADIGAIVRRLISQPLSWLTTLYS